MTIIGDGTDWRFLKDLKRELKATIATAVLTPASNIGRESVMQI